MIIDSNILIYSVAPGYGYLLDYLDQQAEKPSVSAISKLEVLGFHRLTDQSKADLEHLLKTVTELPITDLIIAEAIRLRQQRKRSLGDAIIAATGLIHKLPILTNNTYDFVDIEGLELISLTSLSKL